MGSWFYSDSYGHFVGSERHVPFHGRVARYRALLAIKTITLKAAFGAIKGRTLLAIVTTFGVGTAFETTGLAHWIAMGLIGIFGSLGPFGVVLSVALVTAVVGCAISNNAVVILMYPICQTLANETEGVSLRQLLVVLLVGASSSFLTPMSYQTNLMVFTPGKYRFRLCKVWVWTPADDGRFKHRNGVCGWGHVQRLKRGQK